MKNTQHGSHEGNGSDVDIELHDLLSRRQTPDHGPGFWENVDQSIEQTQPTRKGGIWSGRLTWAAALLAIALAGGAVVLAIDSGGGQNDTSGAASPSELDKAFDEEVAPTTAPPEPTTTLEPDVADEPVDPANISAPAVTVSDFEVGRSISQDDYTATLLAIDYPNRFERFLQSGSDPFVDGAKFVDDNGHELVVTLAPQGSLVDAVSAVSDQSNVFSSFTAPVINIGPEADGFPYLVTSATYKGTAVQVVDEQTGVRQTHIFIAQPGIVSIVITDNVSEPSLAFNDFLAELIVSDGLG